MALTQTIAKVGLNRTVMLMKDLNIDKKLQFKGDLYFLIP